LAQLRGKSVVRCRAHGIAQSEDEISTLVRAATSRANPSAVLAPVFTLVAATSNLLLSLQDYLGITLVGSATQACLGQGRHQAEHGHPLLKEAGYSLTN